MGSKKLKRKKVKIKKLEKHHKLRDLKRKKNLLCNIHKDINYQDLQEINIIDNRSSPRRNSSHVSEKNVSDMKYFCKIRDDYFSHLQLVVSDNCIFYGSIVTEEMLENLVLELEQYALLACLQVDIYRKSMLKIINDIKKSTEEKQLHKDIMKLLPYSIQEKVNQIKSTQSTSSSPRIKTYNRFPIIASSRTDDNLESKENLWREGFNYNSDSYCVITDSCEKANMEYQSDAPNDLYDNTLDEEESYSLHDQSNYCINEDLQTRENNLEKIPNVITSQSLILQNNFSNSENNNDCFLSCSKLSEEKLLTKDPLLISRNQLQKSIEQTLNESEKVKKQKRDELERAYITRILEGDECFNEGLNDSLSDNENDSKENINEPNLMNRLEKMKELFGVEDHSKTDLSAKSKQTSKIDLVNARGRRPTIWRYEKFIQLHKYSIIAAEMTFERRNINQKAFLELFGEDSDEENEEEYSSEEKYRLSCTERISSWVVKYLMPFYHNRRILGRNVFKSLGHYISSAIVDKIQYPDEWTVKYFVSKFFPPKKKYVCEADILDIQVD